MVDEHTIRVDKWLWAARFFKTRLLAREAVSGGHIHLNGLRVKPAREVTVGDELAIVKGRYTFYIAVQAVSAQRGSAVLAQRLYSESAESIAARVAVQTEQRLAAAQSPAHRPDKRARRRIIRFTRQDTE